MRQIAILGLSAEARRKLLMFLHQANDPARVSTELRTDRDGRLDLRLTFQEN